MSNDVSPIRKVGVVGASVPLLATHLRKTWIFPKTLLARVGWLIDRQQAVLHPPEFSGKQWHASTCQESLPHPPLEHWQSQWRSIPKSSVDTARECSFAEWMDDE
jgi:hypothetical protein